MSAKNAMKIGAIIQARVSSTRMPGKVLKELPFSGGVTVLENVIRRVERCRRIGHIIVATTTLKPDDKIASIAMGEGVSFFRGSESDVLSRYYLAAKEHDLDVVVRICSDSPCIDPAVVDALIKRYLLTKADYASNVLTRPYPLGLNAEVFGSGPLSEAYKNAKSDYEREHVTPYLYHNPGKFKIVSLGAPTDLFPLGLRLTLDTPADYVLLCAIFDNLYPKDKYFNAGKIVKLFARKPWLKEINAHIMQKKNTNRCAIRRYY